MFRHIPRDSDISSDDDDRAFCRERSIIYIPISIGYLIVDICIGRTISRKDRDIFSDRIPELTSRSGEDTTILATEIRLTEDTDI